MAEFKLPDLGENIDSGDVVSVMVKEGDVVKPQQEVIEIETDKAVVAVPCSVAGKVTKIHVAKGQTVKPGQVILSLDSAGASAAAPTKTPAAPAKAAPAKAPTVAKAPAKPQAAAKPQVKTEPAKAPPAPAREGNGRSTTPAAPAPAPASAAVQAAAPASTSTAEAAPAGPAVRRLARELGVDLSHVPGTGPGGRITRDDVINSVRQVNVAAGIAASESGAVERDAHGVIRREAMSKIRKTIAANMAKSASTIPHLTNFDDADITELETLRKESAESYASSGIKLTSLAFLLKAVALSLKQHPTLNASVDMESGTIIYKQYVNLGVAVDTERGLIVPVLRDVDRTPIPQIAQGIQMLADKVRSGQHTLEDLRGGSFTISNLGAVGGRYSTPIINAPEVAILLVGRARKWPSSPRTTRSRRG